MYIEPNILHVTSNDIMSPDIFTQFYRITNFINWQTFGLSRSVGLSWSYLDCWTQQGLQMKTKWADLPSQQI